MKIIIVSGYARSGKSTLATKLRKAGIAVASSSDALSEQTLSHFNIPLTPKNMEILEGKKDDEFLELLHQFNAGKYDDILKTVSDSIYTLGTSIRDFKIYVAEDIIVPYHTREFFANSCMAELEKALKFQSNGKPSLRTDIGVIFSTIKSERDILTAKVLWSDWTTGLITCNITSANDSLGVDGRSLWENADLNLYNFKTTPTELLQDFLARVDNYDDSIYDLPF